MAHGLSGSGISSFDRGCFVFDVLFPGAYPNVPPLVNLATTGRGSVRFNPNLYNCGKVCLSLLGTWRGAEGESWSALTSTFLQVAVSIQSLIFIPEPFFNEPGYEREIGTSTGVEKSRAYNENLRLQTIRWAMNDMLEHPPQHFSEIVQTHFRMNRDLILRETQTWVDESRGNRKQIITERDKLVVLLSRL